MSWRPDRLGPRCCSRTSTEESAATGEYWVLRKRGWAWLETTRMGILWRRASLDSCDYNRWVIYHHRIASRSYKTYAFAGALIGLNAAFLNIVTEWLSDVKLGYCTTAFYLNESFCCWGAENGNTYTELLYKSADIDRLRWMATVEYSWAA